MKAIRAASTVIARFLLSAVFLAAGINKIIHWQEAEQSLMDVLGGWESYLSGFEAMQLFFSTLLLFTPALLATATVFELGGAILLLLGIRERLGATLLLLVILPTTLLFHQFWFVDGSIKELQQAMFLKNLAIIGGLIFVLLHGARTPSSSRDY